MRTLLLSGLAVLLLVVLPAAAPAPRHFELDRSMPGADGTVPSLSAVVLWFTQEPQDDATSIRVLDASGEPVPSEALVQDPVDPKVFVLPIPRGLEPGAYSVAWRSMAADGHVVRDEFSFTVAAAR